MSRIKDIKRELEEIKGDYDFLRITVLEELSVLKKIGNWKNIKIIRLGSVTIDGKTFYGEDCQASLKEMGYSFLYHGESGCQYWYKWPGV